jgi:hypothetical protein
MAKTVAVKFCLNLENKDLVLLFDTLKGSGTERLVRIIWCLISSPHFTGIHSDKAQVIVFANYLVIRNCSKNPLYVPR